MRFTDASFIDVETTEGARCCSDTRIRSTPKRSDRATANAPNVFQNVSCVRTMGLTHVVWKGVRNATPCVPTVRESENSSRQRTCHATPCPCGRGRLDLQNDLDRESFDRCMNHFNQLQHQVRRPPVMEVVQSGLLDALSDEAQALRCPACGWRFVDFDGCAALTCECGISFCALCFQGFHTPEEAHLHVRFLCSFNTDNDSYYVPLETCQKVWTIRGRLRAGLLCREVSRRDGRLAGWFLRFLLAWRYPALRPRPWIHGLQKLYQFLHILATWIERIVWVSRGLWKVASLEEPHEDETVA